jgi:hypothetical protein
MIGGVDVGSCEDLFAVDAQIGLNRSASTLNPKKRKALHVVAIPEKSLCQQNGGHHSTLATPPVEAYLHHLCFALLAAVHEAKYGAAQQEVREELLLIVEIDELEMQKTYPLRNG